MKQQREPSQINQLQTYRPPCSRCGAATALARIEPTDLDDHDSRTYECTACGNADTVLVKFK